MRVVLVAGLMMAAIAPAWADVCLLNSKRVADAAAFIFTPGEPIWSYCAPCGDTKAKPEMVGTVSVKKFDPDDDGSYQVLVNRQAVDLAYTYVCRSFGSTDCADIGLTVECTSDKDIPTTIPASALKP